MFVALYNGQRVYIKDFTNPKSELDPKELKCPICELPLFVKHGIIKQAHFSHYPETTCDFERLQGERETMEHIKLKEYMGTFLKEQGYITVDFEVPILNRKRIVDVMGIIPPYDYKIVVECQCSPITLQEVRERTRDYFQIGNIDVWWIFKEGIFRNVQDLDERIDIIGTATFSNGAIETCVLPCES